MSKSNNDGNIDVDKIKAELLEKYSNLKPIDLKRKLIVPELPETLKEFSFCMDGQKELNVSSQMYSQMRLCNSDDISEQSFKNCDITFKCLLPIIAIGNLFDGAYASSSANFTEQYIIPKYEGTFDIKVVSKQQLNRITLEIINYNFAFDVGTLISVDDDQYTYSFLKFKDLSYVLPPNGFFNYVINIDKDIDATVTMKNILLDTDIREQIIWHPTVFSIKNNKIVKYEYNENQENQQWIYMSMHHALQLDLLDDKYKYIDSNYEIGQISEFIKETKIHAREQNIKKHMLNGPCKITKIIKVIDKSAKYYKPCLQFYFDDLSLDDLIQKDSRYTIDDNHFVQLDGKDVSFTYTNCFGNPVEMSIVNHSWSIGILKGIKPIELTNISYPLYVLNICHSHNKIIINLLDGSQLIFYEDDTIDNIKYKLSYKENDIDVILYEF